MTDLGINRQDRIEEKTTGQNPAHIDHCPVCFSMDLNRLVFIDSVPICSNMLLPTREAALKAPVGDIDLCFCKQCSHVFNRAFDPQKMSYNQSYDNSLHFSSVFETYARSLAEELVDKHHMFDKDIIEIGCGKGDFLRLLCEMGSNRGVGFDPSFESERFSGLIGEKFRVIQDYYNPSYSHIKADLVCCRHVLEHIQNPVDFLKSIRLSVEQHKTPIFFFEVPNVMFTLKNLGIWDLIYEHCGYFSQNSLVWAFKNSGCVILSSAFRYGGQFLTIEATPSTGNQDPNKVDSCNSKEILAYSVAFPEVYTRTVDQWRKRLNRMESENKSVVLWGAGSKGITFLNILNSQSMLDCIVDINPHKQGKYIPRTGQKVVPPDFLKTCRPDSILIMNPLYVTEIKSTLTTLGVRAEIISVN
ncbi:MAG: class I SAM-dependent methyltransferase [Pseudomonadota bacterium]